MAICPQSKPTNTSPLSSKCKNKKAMEIKKKILHKKCSTPKQLIKTVNIDLLCNVKSCYDPNLVTTVQPLNSRAKPSAIELATEFQASLLSESPSFVKIMLPSHVSGGFWLGLPKKFCDAHLPKLDETIVLVDEDKQEFETKYLFHKTGLSGGWRGFSIAHKLLEGDALVFQLIEHWKFRVYIVSVNSLNEIDGALGLLNLVPGGVNVYQQETRMGSGNLQIAEDMNVDLHQKKGSIVFDQSEDEGAYEEDSAVCEGLRFSESLLEFKDIKGVEDFSIVVDGLVIDSEIPKHFQIKYYGLCCSQKTYLHENLLKGLNVRLVVGIILETVTISDAIRGCTVTISRDDFETWDKTLKACEKLGMNVRFLRARIGKLVGLLFESKELLEAKRNEQMKAEEDMRMINGKLFELKEVIKNLDVEIKTLNLKDNKLEPVFRKEANAPW